MDSEGDVVRDTAPEPLRQADISDNTLAIVREGMRRVTQPGGPATTAFRTCP